MSTSIETLLPPLLPLAGAAKRIRVEVVGVASALPPSQQDDCSEDDEHAAALLLNITVLKRKRSGGPEGSSETRLSPCDTNPSHSCGQSPTSRAAFPHSPIGALAAGQHAAGMFTNPQQTAFQQALQISNEDSGSSKQSAGAGVAVEQATHAQSIPTGESQGRCKCGKRISADHPPCKSELMLLCEKFQRRFGNAAAEGQSSEIMLKDAATELGVSRRRLYDIINVLEAVEIVRRTGKLTYEWRGLDHLGTLLQRMALEEEQGLPVEERAKRTPAVQGAANTYEPAKEDTRTQHTLWALSRKFVRILLTRLGPLPLADVAQLLMANGVTESRKSQTQITIERRLYDIGSILTATGLIQKTYLGKRQPAFMWTWSPEDGPLLPKAPAPTPLGPSQGTPQLPGALPFPSAAAIYPGANLPLSLGLAAHTWPMFWPHMQFPAGPAGPGTSTGPLQAPAGLMLPMQQPQLFVGSQGGPAGRQGAPGPFGGPMGILLPNAIMFGAQGPPGGPPPGLQWQGGMLPASLLPQQIAGLAAEPHRHRPL